MFPSGADTQTEVQSVGSVYGFLPCKLEHVCVMCVCESMCPIVLSPNQLPELSLKEKGMC